jgi:hypothetical protein
VRVLSIWNCKVAEMSGKRAKANRRLVNAWWTAVQAIAAYDLRDELTSPSAEAALQQSLADLRTSLEHACPICQQTRQYSGMST